MNIFLYLLDMVKATKFLVVMSQDKLGDLMPSVMRSPTLNLGNELLK